MTFELPQILLTVVVVLPAVVAFGLVGSSVLLGLIGLPSLSESTWRGVGLGAAFVTFAVMVFGVAPGFDSERIGLQLVESYVWSETFGANLMLGLDGLGLCFMLSTTAIVPNWPRRSRCTSGSDPCCTPATSSGSTPRSRISLMACTPPTGPRRSCRSSR